MGNVYVLELPITNLSCMNEKKESRDWRYILSRRHKSPDEKNVEETVSNSKRKRIKERDNVFMDHVVMALKVL